VPENDEIPSEEQKGLDHAISEARISALGWGALLAVFVWLNFNGGLNGFAEFLENFLPRFFANLYTFATAIGIGGYLLKQALIGENWFNKFHKDNFHKIRQPWRGYVFGVTLYVSISSVVIFLIWLIFVPISEGISAWIMVPVIFFSVPTAGFALIPMLSFLAKIIGAKM